MSDVYRSGYEHGVQDGKTGTIREDFANHTAKYDQGWVDGYCSIAGEGAGSDSDKGTFECSLDATQFKGINEQTPYQHGFTDGKRDAKTNLYDPANVRRGLGLGKNDDNCTPKVAVIAIYYNVSLYMDNPTFDTGYLYGHSS